MTGMGSNGLLAGLILLASGCAHSYGTEDSVPNVGAEAYTIDVAPGGVRTDNPVVAERLFRAAAAGQKSGLLADGRLAALAEQVGQRLGPAGLLPRPDQIEFLARQLGLPEPSFRVLLVPQGELSHVEEGVTQAIAAQQGDGPPPSHVGIAHARAYGRSFWLVVLTERIVKLSPVPRVVEVGGMLRVAGVLPKGYDNPRVRVRSEAGRGEDLPAGSGPRFDVRVPTPRRTVFHVEVSAKSDAGRRILAVMPVYVGMNPPSAWHGSAEGRPIPIAPAQAERRMIEAIRRARRKAGLPALTVDPALSMVASRHSAEMSRRGVVGHHSAGGSPPERVREAGYKSGLVLENVGRGRDPLSLHEDFMDNPGQRAAVLHPQLTHMGVGVARAVGGSAADYYVTEVFVGVPEQVDLADAGAQVLEHLNTARAALGAQPLELDEALSAVAQDAVVAYFSEPYPDQQEVLERANTELGGFSIAYRKAAAVMALVRSLAEAAALEPALDADATHVGIAVSQGERPGATPQMIALMLTLGWSR